jgi:cell division septal protein FtsQ
VGKAQSFREDILAKGRQIVTRRRIGRRSQRRLGTQYTSTARGLRFSLKPLAGRWQAPGSKLAAALLIAMFGAVIYAIFDSPTFYVFDIELQGHSVVTPEEVYAAAGLEGLSTFWVDPVTVAGRVETLPNVKTAQVRVGLPAQVTITIEERAPQFIWQTGETSWWVDAEGIVVPVRAKIPDALKIMDDDAQPVSAGQSLDPLIIEAAYSLRRLIPELRVVHYSQATGISFKTREGWPVYLGDGKNMDAKLTILVALRNDLLARGVSPEFIDVRFVEKPFYR